MDYFLSRITNHKYVKLKIKILKQNKFKLPKEPLNFLKTNINVTVLKTLPKPNSLIHNKMTCTASHYFIQEIRNPKHYIQSFK